MPSDETTLKHRLARALLLLGAGVVVGVEIVRVGCRQVSEWRQAEPGGDDAE